MWPEAIAFTSVFLALWAFIALVLGRTGQFWQEDYWDTLVRDADHLADAVRYVENNPTKARLVRDPKAWRWSSPRRRDVYGRLP